MPTPEEINNLTIHTLPGYLGIVVTQVSDAEVRSKLTVKDTLIAPNGFLYAGSIVSLADTTAGHGCVASLPQDATGFTTIELKSNHLGSAKDGILDCTAKIVHRGRTTQVWDAVVTHRQTGKTLALFRCTQLILYNPPGKEKKGKGTGK